MNAHGPTNLTWCLLSPQAACANITMTLQRCEVRTSLTQAATAELREQVLSLREQVEALNYSQVTLWGIQSNLK